MMLHYTPTFALRLSSPIVRREMALRHPRFLSTYPEEILEGYHSLSEAVYHPTSYCSVCTSPIIIHEVYMLAEYNIQGVLFSVPFIAAQALYPAPDNRKWQQSRTPTSAGTTTLPPLTCFQMSKLLWSRSRSFQLIEMPQCYRAEPT